MKVTLLRACAASSVGFTCWHSSLQGVAQPALPEEAMRLTIIFDGCKMRDFSWADKAHI